MRQTEPAFVASKPERVFDRRYYAPIGVTHGRTYDISPDGERFLMVKEVGSAASGLSEIILVQNWFSELEGLVPTK